MKIRCRICIEYGQYLCSIGIWLNAAYIKCFSLLARPIDKYPRHSKVRLRKCGACIIYEVSPIINASTDIALILLAAGREITARIQECWEHSIETKHAYLWNGTFGLRSTHAFGFKSKSK